MHFSRSFSHPFVKHIRTYVVHVVLICNTVSTHQVAQLHGNPGNLHEYLQFYTIEYILTYRNNLHLLLLSVHVALCSL